MDANIGHHLFRENQRMVVSRDLSGNVNRLGKIGKRCFLIFLIFVGEKFLSYVSKSEGTEVNEI